VARKFNADKEVPESLAEPLEITVNGKMYVVKTFSVRQAASMAQFHRDLAKAERVARAEIEALGQDPDVELEKMRAEYKKSQLEAGVAEADINVSGVLLADPPMDGMAKYVAAILGEPDENIFLDMSFVKLQRIAEFVWQHLQDFATLNRGVDEVKN